MVRRSGSNQQGEARGEWESEFPRGAEMKGYREELQAGRFMVDVSSCASNFKAKLAETKVQLMRRTSRSPALVFLSSLWAGIVGVINSR